MYAIYGYGMRINGESYSHRTFNEHIDWIKTSINNIFISIIRVSGKMKNKHSKLYKETKQIESYHIHT
jgi:hypothetical protein